MQDLTQVCVEVPADEADQGVVASLGVLLKPPASPSLKKVIYARRM